MVRHLHDIAGGAVVTAPSMADFDHPGLRPLLEKYLGTGPGISGEYRTRLFHAIRDTTARFAADHIAPIAAEVDASNAFPRAAVGGVPPCASSCRVWVWSSSPWRSR